MRQESIQTTGTTFEYQIAKFNGTPDGELVTRRLSLSVRDNNVPGLTGLVMNHFLQAAGALAMGMTQLPANYKVSPAEKLKLDEQAYSRVVINADLLVSTDTNVIREVKLWRVDEFASAIDIIDHVLAYLGDERDLEETYSDWALRALSAMSGRANAPAHSAQPSAVSQTELSEEALVTTYSQNGTPHLGDYDYKLRSEYARLFGGKVVSFNVWKIEREFSKTGEPQFSLYSTYRNGENSAYPAWRFVTPEHIKDERTKEYLEKQAARPVGSQVVIDDKKWRALVFVNPKGDKVYFNLNKLELVDAWPGSTASVGSAEPSPVEGALNTPRQTRILPEADAGYEDVPF